MKKVFSGVHAAARAALGAVAFVFVFLLACLLYALYAAPAHAQYPKNTQIQRFSDGSVRITTSPGADARYIRTHPAMVYGSTVYQKHSAVASPQQAFTHSGVTLDGTVYAAPEDPGGYRLDYLRMLNSKSVMRVCVNYDDRPTQCRDYR